MCEQIREHVWIILVDCVEEAVSLLGWPTEPLLNKSFVVVAGQLFTVLVENLKTIELIGVTSEN